MDLTSNRISSEIVRKFYRYSLILHLESAIRLTIFSPRDKKNDNYHFDIAAISRLPYPPIIGNFYYWSMRPNQIDRKKADNRVLGKSTVLYPWRLILT